MEESDDAQQYQLLTAMLVFVVCFYFGKLLTIGSRENTKKYCPQASQHNDACGQ